MISDTKRFTLATLALIALSVAILLATSPASATPIYDNFGPFPNATFGGTGIPNNSVAASSQIIDGDVTITIAMNATQRFSNPVVTDNGAGTFFALPGSNDGLVGDPTLGSRWNFNFYMDVEGTNGATPKITDYQFDLYYDFDTGFDTPLANLGSIDITNSVLFSADPNATRVEGSQNLLFGFLSVPVPGFVNPPAGAFDPNALGEYNFAIQVTDSGGFGVETVAMDVRIVPEPATLALLGLGALGLGLQRRRSLS